MIEVSSKTSLFGDDEQNKIFINYDDFADYKNMFVLDKPDEKPEKTEKKTVIKKENKFEHKAIIQQSNGSKIFELLKNIKPQPRKPQPVFSDEVKSEVPKRKLTMSSSNKK